MSLQSIPTAMFQQGLSGLAWSLQAKFGIAISPNELELSAMVFAPHPDDESLACGGTILKKVAAGASVQVVFMTDGRSSHAQFMPANELAVLRIEEGIAACKLLGLSPSDVHALNFHDNHLAEHHGQALESVRNLLRERRPKTVFIPYMHDITADHEATARIVLEALRAEKQETIVYEYPIWFWNHFPWMHFALHPRRQALRYLSTSLSNLLGFGMALNFRHYLDVRAELPEKYLALAEHRSQMERLVADSAWATLPDVSEGRFLACFFQGVEIFRRSVVGAKA